MKTILLSAAASLMLMGAAVAGEGLGEPFGRAPHSAFVIDVPTVDTGSQAYQATGDAGADTFSLQSLQPNPALQYSPDTGSEQLPVGLR